MFATILLLTMPAAPPQFQVENKTVARFVVVNKSPIPKPAAALIDCPCVGPGVGCGCPTVYGACRCTPNRAVAPANPFAAPPAACLTGR